VDGPIATLQHFVTVDERIAPETYYLFICKCHLLRPVGWTTQSLRGGAEICVYLGRPSEAYPEEVHCLTSSMLGTAVHVFQCTYTSHSTSRNIWGGRLKYLANSSPVKTRQCKWTSLFGVGKYTPPFVPFNWSRSCFHQSMKSSYSHPNRPTSTQVSPTPRSLPFPFPILHSVATKLCKTRGNHALSSSLALPIHPFFLSTVTTHSSPKQSGNFCCFNSQRLPVKRRAGYFSFLLNQFSFL